MKHLNIANNLKPCNNTKKKKDNLKDNLKKKRKLCCNWKEMKRMLLMRLELILERDNKILIIKIYHLESPKLRFHNSSKKETQMQVFQMFRDRDSHRGEDE